MFSLALQTIITADGIASWYALSVAAQITKKVGTPPIVYQALEAASRSKLDLVTHLFDIIDRDRTKEL